MQLWKNYKDLSTAEQYSAHVFGVMDDGTTREQIFLVTFELGRHTPVQ